MFSIQFSSSCKTKLGVFLCVLCVVLIFECILLQCEFAKDIISLNFSFTVFSFFLFLICWLWPITFRKLDINSEFDILLIFWFVILLMLFFYLIVKYSVAVCLMHLFTLSLCTCSSVHLSDCCWWINYVPVMWS